MINVFPPAESVAEEHWQIWIDVSGDPKNGICIGCGHSREEALRDAKKNLHKELRSIALLQMDPFEKSQDCE